mmetsp:Transcript_24618/g.43841  ORF Transcript_24618/g.43841 Transcript_24618/m.43841 type:complete len:80 (-) Transcript_24618:76-315(-)
MSKPTQQSEASGLVQRDWENRRDTADLVAALQELNSFISTFDSSVRGRLADLSARLRRLELLVEGVEAEAGRAAHGAQQ